MSGVAFPSAVVVTQEFKAVAIPKRGICLNEAMDKWLSQGDNKVLDYGDKKDTRLLVAHEKTQQMLLEIIREATDENVRPEDILAGVRAMGYDVRGFGPKSKDGNPTVVVCEKVN